MNITAIRAHLESMILNVDPDLVRLEDEFDDQTVTTNDAEKGYKITFETNTNSRDPNSYMDLLPFKIAIYNPTDRDETGSFDNLYTKAFAIRNQVIDPKCILQDEFTQILASTITPTILDTSDKSIKMEISFVIQNDFKFC